MALLSVGLSTDGALKGFDILDEVNCRQVRFKMAFISKPLSADAAHKRLDITDTDVVNF